VLPDRPRYDDRMRKLVFVAIILVLAAAAAFIAAGYAAAPVIAVVSPGKFVGASTPFELTVDAPDGRLASLSVDLEQGDRHTRLVDLASDGTAGAGVTVTREGGDRLRVTRSIGSESVPGLTSGQARLVVSASRPVLFGLRRVSATASRDIAVRLERPRVSVLSTHHYINVGGSEMVVYRVSPDDVASGVRVGEIEYPGYPASGATVDGVKITDPAARVAFFALLYDEDVDTPIRLFARDEAGNAATADLERRAFPKPARQSRIVLDDTFIDRVVPAILAGTTEVKPEGSTIEKYVVINSELRKKNADKIASFASQTAPEMLWRGVPFHAFANNAVEAAFADRRTYVYQGREVDRQVHLGFDLASVAHAPVPAANRGRVLFAGDLGIYGNAVIIDHGMGVQSLYGHLSSIDVKVGDMVEQAQEIGRTGMTGLAGGDHLHFTMLVAGHMVSPIEWWDPHWVEDRILRKLREAGPGV